MRDSFAHQFERTRVTDQPERDSTYFGSVTFSPSGSGALLLKACLAFFGSSPQNLAAVFNSRANDGAALREVGRPRSGRNVVDANENGLDIGPHDVLLDLCYANDAIMDPIFALCRAGLGVDFTPYLIEVAKTNFERSPDRLYLLADALEYVGTTDDAKRFTKAICYGAFQCLAESKAIGVRGALRRRFPNLQRIFVGNLRDLDRVGKVLEGDIPSPEELKRHDTLFGVWRTEAEMAKLTAETGWRIEFSRMPAAFYGAHYRFDATLAVAPGETRAVEKPWSHRGSDE